MFLQGQRPACDLLPHTFKAKKVSSSQCSSSRPNMTYLSLRGRTCRDTSETRSPNGFSAIIIIRKRKGSFCWRIWMNIEKYYNRIMLLTCFLAPLYSHHLQYSSFPTNTVLVWGFEVTHVLLHAVLGHPKITTTRLVFSITLVLIFLQSLIESFDNNSFPLDMRPKL